MERGDPVTQEHAPAAGTPLSAYPPPAYPSTGYPPPAFPPPVAGHPPYAPTYVQASTNGFAIAALVLGILGAWILALIFGYVGKGQIDRSHGAQGGRGMAIAGIVLGWVGLAFTILFVIVIIAAASNGG
jgi:Domain of unknown function (DUF4190)